MPVAMFITTLISAELPVPRSREIVPLLDGVHYEVRKFASSQTSISKFVPELIT